MTNLNEEELDFINAQFELDAKLNAFCSAMEGISKTWFTSHYYDDQSYHYFKCNLCKTLIATLPVESDQVLFEHGLLHLEEANSLLPFI